MRHRKTPRWVMELKRAPGTGTPPAPMLSDLIGTIEVACQPCGRRGRYRADRLIAEFGDIYLPQVLEEIAKRAGCHQALHPPLPSSSDYGKGCQIKLARAVNTGD